MDKNFPTLSNYLSANVGTPKISRAGMLFRQNSALLKLPHPILYETLINKYNKASVIRDILPSTGFWVNKGAGALNHVMLLGSNKNRRFQRGVKLETSDHHTDKILIMGILFLEQRPKKQTDICRNQSSLVRFSQFTLTALYVENFTRYLEFLNWRIPSNRSCF